MKTPTLFSDPAVGRMLGWRLEMAKIEHARRRQAARARELWRRRCRRFGLLRVMAARLIGKNRRAQ